MKARSEADLVELYDHSMIGKGDDESWNQGRHKILESSICQRPDGYEWWHAMPRDWLGFAGTMITWNQCQNCIRESEDEGLYCCLKTVWRSALVPSWS